MTCIMVGFDRGSSVLDDVKLRQRHHSHLHYLWLRCTVETDAFIRKILQAEPFQKRMGTAEFHHLLGKYVWGGKAIR